MNKKKNSDFQTELNEQNKNDIKVNEVHTTSDTYKQQQMLSVQGFLAELPNFIAVAVSLILSGSLIVWLDFIDSFGNLLGISMVVLLSRYLRKDLKYAYNYGIGKIEAVASIACELIVLCGLTFTLICSCAEIIHPKQPSDFLGYVVILKIINVAFDSYFLIKQRKIYINGKTSIAESEYYASINAFAFDAVALVSIFVCWVFRNYKAAWYFSPVICVGFSIVLAVMCIRRIRKSIRELTDQTLPESEQLKILGVMSKFFDDYEQFDSIDSHISGNIVYIDLNLKFAQDMPYREIEQFKQRISKAIEDVIPGSKVSIKI